MGYITIFSIGSCPHCAKSKSLFQMKGWKYVDISLDEYPEKRSDMIKLADRTSVPQIFFNERHLGGASDVEKLDEEGRLDALYTTMLAQPDPTDPRLHKPDYPPKVAAPLHIPEEEFFVGEHRYTYTQLMELLLRPVGEGGVDIQDRTYHLRRYPKCFVGEEFASYLMKAFGIQSRADAVSTAAQLHASRLFHHVVDGHAFEDRYLFYRFQVHEDPTILNMSKINTLQVSLDPMALVGQLRRELNAVVKQHTGQDGMVDYAAVNVDPAFQEFQAKTSLMQGVDLSLLDPTTSRKAFCINVYNMMVLHAYAAVGVPRNSMHILRYFGKIAYRLGNFDFTAEDIENGILRGNKHRPYTFLRNFGRNDPRAPLSIAGGDCRIHFALNCGARSCPPVKNFTAEAINEELDVAAQAFLEDDENLRVDLVEKRLYASKILSWYGGDFGASPAEVAMALVPFCRGRKRADLEELIGGGGFKMVFTPYDWGNNASTSPEIKF